MQPRDSSLGLRSPRSLLAAAAMVLAAGPQLANAFYLPGVAPTSYKPNDKVPLFVNTIKPIASPNDALLHSVVSYDYYHPLFKMCAPAGGPQSVGESLGSILFGDRIKTSPFELYMAKNETCKPLCRATYEQGPARFINKKITQGYSLNWLVDGLPAGQRFYTESGAPADEAADGAYYSPGFLLGAVDGAGTVMFNNHYDIWVDYHKVRDSETQLRVVGVRVEPFSISYGRDEKLTEESCAKPHDPVSLDENGDTEVQFSYSVLWVESPTVWATRWDRYLQVLDPKIHWLSLINASVVDAVLVVTVMSVLARSLRRDIARYNRLDQIDLDDLSSPAGNGHGGAGSLEDGVQEDSGWKLVHGDVFRNPPRPLLLSVFLGNGAQLFVMAGVTIAFALLGFLSPSNRGSLATILLLSYTVLSFVGGYVSARVYKSMQGEQWKTCIVLTPVMVPTIVFSTFFLLNLFLWAKESSGAVPFTTMLVIVLIWFVISAPLSFAGSWLGFRRPAVEPPVRTNQIPRQIPPMPGYMRSVPSMLLVGLLPFVVIFVELYFIMNSIWFSKIYYMFGFLFLCYGLMVVTCASVTVLLVYFLLCAENYNWQWRSFLAAGASSLYIFAYALLFRVSQLSLGGWAGTVLYVGYSALISFLFFILTGSVGYFASWWFTRKIYASIKID